MVQFILNKMAKCNSGAAAQNAQTVSEIQQPCNLFNQPRTMNIITATDNSKVTLYYNKSRTFKHLVGARSAALAFQHCLKLHNKKRVRKRK
jgi:hypothetical protein